MNGLKKILLFLFLAPLALNVHAQDPFFSQYYASALYLNPAMASQTNALSASLNYRQQWRSIVIPYVTSQVSVIAPIHAKRSGREVHIGGIGGSIYNDMAGDGNFRTTGININAAYNLFLAHNLSQMITFGLQGGLIQKGVNYSNLQWGEQYNPYIGFDASKNPGVGTNANKLYPDIGAGIIYNYTGTKHGTEVITGFAGLSAYHLNSPNESMYPSLISHLPVLYKLHGGVDFKVTRQIKISPNALFMKQGKRTMLNTGAYMDFSLITNNNNNIQPTNFIIGTWYRLQDAFIVSSGIANDTYTLGFSYDFNTSNLRYNTQGKGAFELSLTVRKIKNKKFRRYNTPRF